MHGSDYTAFHQLGLQGEQISELAPVYEPIITPSPPIEIKVRFRRSSVQGKPLPVAPLFGDFRVLCCNCFMELSGDGAFSLG